MSRTKHNNSNNHAGHDFGGKHKCNKGYNQSYGSYGRDRLHEELRQEDKDIIMEAIYKASSDYMDAIDMNFPIEQNDSNR